METQQRHTDCLVKAGHTVTSETWGDFFYEVEVLTSELVEHGRAFMILDIPGDEEVFVQLMVSRDGTVHAEAPKTVLKPCCGRRHELEPERQALLLSFGWCGPDPSRDRPLWWREADPRWPIPQMVLSELLVRTLVEVFRAESPKSLELRFGNSPTTGPYTRNL
jgi:hypothetical protein